ncbi:hypothetical protein D915_007059 [Fasciola hepatica]|uniref:Uncharacterized protein n=1 Tax=Fasciola hepatica TaxID=6192 RepID=A0A4E0R8A1_FASHE|nr:hypothetical protein D915_007059 [Fasciola hepatica]
MLALGRWYNLISRTTIRSHFSAELFIIHDRNNHNKPFIEFTTIPAEQSKIHLTVLRRYRKLLQDLIASGSLGDEFGFLEITDIVPLVRKGHFEVRCFLPSLLCTENTQTDSHIRSLALKLQQSMNIQSREIRSRVCQHQVEYKRPTFHFIVETDAKPICAVRCNHENSGNMDLVKAQSVNTRFTVVKPNNVYDLPRDDLLKKVRSAMKTRDYMCGQNCGPEEEEPPKPTRTDSRITTEWEKLWKQRQDARNEARRERKRARQNVGLYRLTRDQSGVTILDLDNDEE